MAESNAVVRDTRGRFVPGNPGGPGNPNARRLNEYRSAILQAVSPEMLRALMRRLMKSALEGNPIAARIVLERALGKPSSAPEGAEFVSLDLPEIATARDTVSAASKVLGALSDGEIGPDDASKLIAVVEAVRRCLETADLETRLCELERRNG